MKKFIKHIKQLALAGSVVTGVGLSSCSDMNELSDRFMNSGETVYAAKIDSVATHAGYKKVEVEIHIATLKIDSVKVYWDDYQYSTTISVNNRRGVFRTIVDNLEERSYIFQLISIDSYGNQSLPVEVSGEAFGDSRLSLLRKRNISTAGLTPATGVLIVKWGAEVENSFGCRIAYTNQDDEPAFVIVPPDSTVTTIFDFKSGLRYATQFVLGDADLAEMYTTDEVRQSVLKVWNTAADKAAWSAEASSFHDAPRAASAAIDGNSWQPWHSAASGQSMPQWIIIDFGAGNALPIDGIILQDRIDDIGDRAFPKTILWEASNDKTAWTTILAYEALVYPTASVETPQWLPCTTSSVARYLRGTISLTWPTSRGYTYIGEIGIYQNVE
jgi:hypothetical protein